MCEDEIVRHICRRSGILEALLDQPHRRTELVNAVNCSRSTVYRTLNDLEKAGLVVDEASRYRITPLGHYAYNDVTAVRNRLRQAVRLDKVAEVAAQEEFVSGDFPTEVTIIEADSVHPNRPTLQFNELLPKSSSVHGYIGTIQSTLFNRAEDGSLQGHLLASNEVFTHLLESDELSVNPSESDEVGNAQGANASVSALGNMQIAISADDLPFDVFIFDRSLCAVILSENTGVRALILDQSESMVTWATSRLSRVGFSKRLLRSLSSPEA